MDGEDQASVVRKLSRIIKSVEDRSAPANIQAIPTGWRQVDRFMSGGSCDAGGLPKGFTHEFYATACVPAAQAGGDAPICVLAHLAAQAASMLEGQIVWVGRRRPNPQFLDRAGLLDRSLFVEASTLNQRLWAIELAMRSAAVAAVVGDGEGFKLPATRRLELAARQGDSLVLLARPATEQPLPSAAWTRWRITRRLSDSLCPSWELELLRCKGRQQGQGMSWPLEWDDAKGVVTVSAAVVDRLPEAAAGQGRRRRWGAG